jgi:hypothetical protein
MARLVVRRVRRQLESIRRRSRRVAHLLRNVLAAIEAKPSSFAELQ